MLDKIESPFVMDGYGLSIAYACMLEVVRSISTIIEGLPEPSAKSTLEEMDSEKRGKHWHIIVLCNV